MCGAPGCAWEPQVQVSKETPGPPKAHRADAQTALQLPREQAVQEAGWQRNPEEREAQAPVRLLSFLRL